jgi:peroxiredoxin
VTDFHMLPRDLPVPLDDGEADHLTGLAIPSVRLVSTLGVEVDLADAARQRVVVYAYPRTGKPGEALPEGWDGIPGARGCTPQSCAFRDHVEDFAAFGVKLIGLSAQSPEDQLEFATREHIPYPLLSDRSLEVAAKLRLPTFAVAGLRLYRRLTLIAHRGRVEKVFYPVFPPDRNAADVLAWLAEQTS